MAVIILRHYAMYVEPCEDSRMTWVWIPKKIEKAMYAKWIVAMYLLPVVSQVRLKPWSLTIS